MSITLEGMENVIDRIENLVDEKKLRAAIGKACALVERTAKEKAPKGDGELRGSIKSRIEGDGIATEGIVYTPLEYAPYVEYGTGIFAEGGKGRQDVPWVYVEDNPSGKKSTRSYTLEEAEQAVAWLQSKGLDAHLTYGEKPQPYMRPALYENREQIKRILKEGLINDR